MKKQISVFCCFLLLLTGCLPAAAATGAGGTAYYVDAISGSDETGDGLTPETAWKTIPVNRCTLNAGDSVFFRRGGVYACTLTLENCVGTADAPITITAYGEGDKPMLTTDEKTEVLRLFDCSYVTVSDLEISAPNGGGIWIDTINRESERITLTNLSIHNIHFYDLDFLF